MVPGNACLDTDGVIDSTSVRSSTCQIYSSRLWQCHPCCGGNDSSMAEMATWERCSRKWRANVRTSDKALFLSRTKWRQVLSELLMRYYCKSRTQKVFDIITRIHPIRLETSLKLT